jgi:RNA polymerase sigma-70 factor, ECF subfamily
MASHHHHHHDCTLCTTHPRELVSDLDVVQRVLEGDTALFEVILHRYNQRLYRVARSILVDDMEAEDAIQQAYINAYTHLRQFAGRSTFATWLTTITINEARARLRPRRSAAIDQLDEAAMARIESKEVGPEEEFLAIELSDALQSVIDRLPHSYREVLHLRQGEGLGTWEVARRLGVPSDVVKTRLYRARQMVRASLSSRNCNHAHSGVSPASAPSSISVTKMGSPPRWMLWDRIGG